VARKRPGSAAAQAAEAAQVPVTAERSARGGISGDVS